MSGTRSARTPRPVKATKQARVLQNAPESSAAVPRVDLLPPEVHERQRTASVRSTIILLAILAIVIVGGGFAFASLVLVQSSAALAEEQERTLDLLSQQQDYIEIRHLQSRVTASEAAERVGLSTEINWTTTLQQIASVRPPGVEYFAFKSAAATPLEAFPQPTVLLQDSRIASLEVTFASPTVPDAAAMSDGIEAGVTGVTDSVHVETVWDITSARYLAKFMVYFDKDVLVITEGDSE